MNNRQKLISKLGREYQNFFRRFGIDTKTGCAEGFPGRKFPTYPYIGSKYGTSAKLLVVGLDIGADEKRDSIQSFEERREAIEEKPLSKHNQHIAGTYFTALFFLKDELGWDVSWNKLKNIRTCQRALKGDGEYLPETNPLSHISLTNFYKFVAKGRTKRTGGIDRKFPDGDFERKFFIGEVKTFNPDVVIFQSAEFGKPKHRGLLQELSKTVRSVLTGPHPSWREKKEPEYFVRQIKRFEPSNY